MSEERKYKEGARIYLLLDGDHCAAVLEDWLVSGSSCDLVVHRSTKNKGKFVVETRNLMWANRVIQWHRPEKVTYHE